MTTKPSQPKPMRQTTLPLLRTPPSPQAAVSKGQPSLPASDKDALAPNDASTMDSEVRDRSRTANPTSPQTEGWDDDNYEVTEELLEEEADEEFQTNDYVDEVRMKREEDAQEAKEEEERKNNRKKDNLVINTSTTNSKRKNDDRSPQAQAAGSTTKKAPRASVIRSSTANKTYRQVNSKSSNRRVCTRLPDEDAATPERHNRWTHAFKTRFTFKIKIPAVEKPVEALSNILQEFIQELTQQDPTAAVLPWQSNDYRSKRLAKSSDVPTTIAQLRKYLKRFYAGKANKESTIYPGIFIGHDIPHSDLREQLQDWMDTGSHAMYYMMLQAEDSSEIGWLLYTTREMDAGAMADEIADLVGVQVGLRWKVIDIGVKGKIPDAQKVNALTVEVETKYKWEAQQKLIKYFGRDRKDNSEYPNGVRVRFVKQRKDALGLAEKGKLDRLRSRQQLFLKSIQTTETWDIVQLDYNCGNSGAPTLRQMIMGLTTGQKKTPLFHSVDLDWKGVGYVFQYSPTLKAEAECTIHTLLPLLQYHYPECALEGNFTQETVDRCLNMHYDAATGTVIDPTVEESLKFIDDENLPGFELDISALSQSADDQRPAERTGFPSDLDSVSTLGRGAATVTQGAVSRNTVSVNTSFQSEKDDDASIFSSTSTITVETIQTIQTQLHTLQQQVSNTDSRFNELMDFLRQGDRDTLRAQSRNGTSATAATLDAGGGPAPSSGNVP